MTQNEKSYDCKVTTTDTRRRDDRICSRCEVKHDLIKCGSCGGLRLLKEYSRKDNGRLKRNCDKCLEKKRLARLEKQKVGIKSLKKKKTIYKEDVSQSF